MNKLFTLLALILLCVGGVKAEDVVLFDADFSKSPWKGHQFELDEVYNGIYAHSNNNRIGTAKISDSGVMTYMDNNMNASHYFAIKVSGVNKTLKISFKGSSRLKWNVGEENTYNNNTAATSFDTNNTGFDVEYTMIGTGTDAIIYFGRQGSSYTSGLTGITITTPDASTVITYELTSISINGTTMSNNNLSSLKANKSLTITDTFDGLPTVKYTITQTINGVAEEPVETTATIVPDDENYKTSFTMDGNTYVITFTGIVAKDVLDVTGETTVPLTKENIISKMYLAVSTDNWATGKTYGDYTGDFYNLSSTDRNITIKVEGAAYFEVFVYNTNEGRSYKVQAETFNHSGKGMESTGLLSCSTDETTITIEGGGASVYPVYAKFYTTFPTVSVSVTSAGFATYTPSVALDFSSSTIKAYKASVSGSNISFTRVNQVAAGEGVLLYAEGGKTEDIPVGSKSVADTDNAFVGTLTDIDALATDEATAAFTNYILNDGASGIGFYKANGQKVAAGKAYLRVDTSAGAKTFFGFDSLLGIDGVVTGINEVKSAANDNILYNLNGVRVAVPTQKGVYILNGKKYVVK